MRSNQTKHPTQQRGSFVLTYQKHRWLLPVILIIITSICDQITKIWIVQELGPEPLMSFRPLAGDWFRLVYYHNTGIAFNLFPNVSPIFTITSLIICGLLIYAYIVYLPNQSMFVQVSIGLILGGAVGNIIDRVRLGYVIDFIQVGWWPVFNIADSAITIGAVVLALYVTFAREEEPTPPSHPHDEHLLQELLSRDIPKE
jgi:signal peptidase II